MGRGGARRRGGGIDPLGLGLEFNPQQQGVLGYKPQMTKAAIDNAKEVNAKMAGYEPRKPQT